MTTERDIRNQIATAREQGVEAGIEIGMEEGMEKGMEKGREEERSRIVAELRKRGVSEDVIANL